MRFTDKIRNADDRARINLDLRRESLILAYLAERSHLESIGIIYSRMRFRFGWLSVGDGGGGAAIGNLVLNPVHYPCPQRARNCRFSGDLCCGFKRTLRCLSLQLTAQWPNAGCLVAAD